MSFFKEFRSSGVTLRLGVQTIVVLGRGGLDLLGLLDLLDALDKLDGGGRIRICDSHYSIDSGYGDGALDLGDGTNEN